MSQRVEIIQKDGDIYVNGKICKLDMHGVWHTDLTPAEMDAFKKYLTFMYRIPKDVKTVIAV